MTERFDHAAEAERLLEQFPHPSLRSEESLAARSHFLAGAQVHATLALVEQQQTANRIAYLQMAVSALMSGSVLDYEEDAIERLDVLAYEGLGLS